MNKTIPIIFLAVAIGWGIAWFTSDRTVLSGISATNATFSAVSYRVGTRGSNTQVISSSRGASFTTGIFSGDLNTQDLVQGGGIKTLTSGATITVAAADICDYSVLKWVPTATSSTSTFDTAANIVADCLTEDGDYKDVVLWNASAITTTTIVFVAGTGNTLYIPEASGADKVIEYANLANLRFTRASSTAVFISINEELVQ